MTALRYQIPASPLGTQPCLALQNNPRPSIMALPAFPTAVCVCVSIPRVPPDGSCRSSVNAFWKRSGRRADPSFTRIVSLPWCSAGCLGDGCQC